MGGTLYGAGEIAGIVIFNVVLLVIWLMLAWAESRAHLRVDSPGFDEQNVLKLLAGET